MCRLGEFSKSDDLELRRISARRKDGPWLVGIVLCVKIYETRREGEGAIERREDGRGHVARCC